jgi:transposase-like protein
MTADLFAPQFQDADKAREYLEALRWPNGPVCPHCGVEGDHYALKGASHRPGLMKCKDCRKQFSVTVGTVFEKSKIPLNKWLMAVHLMCASKKAVSSHQIHRMLGVTYKSAWFMTHRIREAMKPEGTGLMGTNGGTVEADETYWGTSKAKAKGARGYAHKMKVVSLVERGGEKRSIVVKEVNIKSMTQLLEANICKSANLMTDEHSAYVPVGKTFASHGVTKHGKKQYAVGNVHSNTVESSFSLLKRGLVGTFHHVGEQHLQRYVTEFDFRWNTRTKMGFTDSERAQVALRSIAGKRLTYRQINA